MIPMDDEWVGFFDPDGVWFHVVATWLDRGDYTFPRLDRNISDPAGNFLVYVSREGQDVRFSVRCAPGPDGFPLALHERFDDAYFGDMTLRWGDIKKSVWRHVESPWKGRRPTTWVPSGEVVPYILGDLIDPDET